MNTHSGQLGEGARIDGRYEIVRCLRRGGMGAVYEVVHLDTRRRRALKLMLPSIVEDPELRERFRREATVAAEVESAHVVETFDAGIDPATGAPFLVMELLRGEDLGERLAARGRLEPEEVVLLLGQAAQALERTHAAGIVHRDLKPDNLFLTRLDDGRPHLKVLDFGIAKVVAQSRRRARSTASIGTPLYMAPEQIAGDGDLSARADLYSLAHIAFALLVGEAYFEPVLREGGLFALLQRVTGGPEESATLRARALGVTLPVGFDAWFRRAAALAPEKRFGGAGELVRTLAEVLEVAPPPPVVPDGGDLRDVIVVNSVRDPSAATLPIAGGATGRDGGGAATTGRGLVRSLARPMERARRPWLVGGLAAAGLAALALGLGRLAGAGASNPEASVPGDGTTSPHASAVPASGGDASTSGSAGVLPAAPSATVPSATGSSSPSSAAEPPGGPGAAPSASTARVPASPGARPGPSPRPTATAAAGPDLRRID